MHPGQVGILSQGLDIKINYMIEKIKYSLVWVQFLSTHLTDHREGSLFKKRKLIRKGATKAKHMLKHKLSGPSFVGLYQ